MDDLLFWIELYQDDEINRQIYSAPTQSIEELFQYLSHKNAHTVWCEDQRIAGFTVTKTGGIMGTFGIVIHKHYRHTGYGQTIMRMIEQTARELDIRTLRADVFEDNTACLRLLDTAGFRRFAWLEKNI